MTDILQLIFYNAPSTASVLDVVEKFVNMGSSVLMGVVAIIGLGYIKPLKDKTRAATFTFWSQLSVRLTVICKWIKQDNGILDNMYSHKAKKGWSVLAPNVERITEFKGMIESTLDYIKATSDQMPAYKGWSEDYTKIIGYLSDMIIYDIADNNDYFKFTAETTENEREKYCLQICKTIEKMCAGIETKQKRIEKKIVWDILAVRCPHRLSRWERLVFYIHFIFVLNYRSNGIFLRLHIRVVVNLHEHF